MLDNSLKIAGLLNTYVQNKDPKLYQLIKMINDNISSNTDGVRTISKSLGTLTTNVNNGSIMSSDSVLSLISLRV
jgi:hypothetical protein